MERFWKWIRYYANKKVKKHYMDRVRHDRKCNICNTWTSEVGGCANLEQDGYFDFMTCKKCGGVTKWDCTGMLPFIVND